MSGMTLDQFAATAQHLAVLKGIRDDLGVPLEVADGLATEALACAEGELAREVAVLRFRIIDLPALSDGRRAAGRPREPSTCASWRRCSSCGGR